MKQHFTDFKYNSGFFFEFLKWRLVKSSVSNLRLPRPGSSADKSWGTCSSAEREPITTKWTKHQLILDVCVFQLYLNANSKGVLVLSWIKCARLFQNKRWVNLLTHSSANFLYQNNERTPCVVNLMILPKNEKFVFS